MAVRIYPHIKHEVKMGDALPNVLTQEQFNLFLQANTEGYWEDGADYQSECEVGADSLKKLIEGLKDPVKRVDYVTECPLPLETENEWDLFIMVLEKLYNDADKTSGYVHWSWF